MLPSLHPRSFFAIALSIFVALLFMNRVPFAEAVNAFFYTDTELEGSLFMVKYPDYNTCYVNDEMTGLSSFVLQGDMPVPIPYSITVFQSTDCSGTGYTYFAMLIQNYNMTIKELEPGFNDNINSVSFSYNIIPREGFTYNNPSMETTRSKLTSKSTILYIAPVPQ